MGHRRRGPGNFQWDNLPGGARRVLQLPGGRDSDKHLVELGGETPEKCLRAARASQSAQDRQRTPIRLRRVPDVHHEMED